MTNREKKEIARLLYTRGAVATQGELAARVGVSEVTISNWKNKEGWEEQRESLLATRQEELRRLYRQLVKLNDLAEENDDKVLHTKDMDRLSKLTAAIRSLETDISLSDVIDVSIKVIEWVRSYDVKKAQEVSELFDGYIKSQPL